MKDDFMLVNRRIVFQFSIPTYNHKKIILENTINSLLEEKFELL